MTVVVNVVGEFETNQTYQLRFGGMSYKMSVGSPATATIAIQGGS